MKLTEKTLDIRFQGVKSPVYMALVALSCLFSSYANADIYRFVTIDGIETFTDAPVNRNARIIIKERSVSIAKKANKTGTDRIHEVSLNQIVEKTVTTSIRSQDLPLRYVEPQLPPVGGSITSGTGMRIDPIDGKWRQHNGIDIAIPEGTPVTPAAPGIVVYSGLRSGYGYTILVEHNNGMITLYGHNSRLLAITGQLVDAESAIALSGNTGRSTGPHLHFEAWQSGVNVTPSFMPRNTQKLLKIQQLASARTKNHFRKEILADGSVLFTNIPSTIP